MTYIKKLQLQDNHNIRLSDSTEGKETQRGTSTLGWRHGGCLLQNQISGCVLKITPERHHHQLTWFCSIYLRLTDLFYISHVYRPSQTSFLSQETSGNTVGLLTSSATLVRAFCMPTWYCLWKYLLWDMSNWRSKPLLHLQPHYMYITALQQLQRAAAFVTTSHSISAHRTPGHRSASRLLPWKIHWGTQFLNVLHIWSPSGKEVQISTNNKVLDKISEVEVSRSFK